MRTMASILALALWSNAYAFASPATKTTDPYFLVGSDQTTELAVSPIEVTPDADWEVMTGIGETIIILDRLITLGEKVWKIVEAGRPTANFSNQRVDVVPQGINRWQELSGWQIPVSKRYERKIKNHYGADVVTFRYRIIYNYGGSYNGQGAYLMGVTVYPEVVEVAWGWSFDATASVPTFANAGNSENPVAAAELLISSRVRTTLTHLENSESYYVRGDGTFIDLQK